jgi:probable F420-dependent oxidoreductase
MRAPTLGVVLPYWLRRPDSEALSIAREATAAGFERLWIGEMATFDAFALATAVGLQAPSLRLTVGPLAVGVRSPAAMSLGLASVATLTGSRVDLALGASSPDIVTGWHDRSWAGNPERMAESVAVLRDLLAGQRVDFSGEYVRTRGFKLRRPQPGATISVAAFGPRMTRTAAEVADEVVLNLVAPEHVARVRTVVDAIADAAGRPAPRLAVWVTASVEPGPATLAQVAEQLAVYLAPPGYGEMFTGLGFGELVAKARGARLRRDALARQIPAGLPRAVGAIGSGQDVLDRIRAYFAAGADHVGIVPATADDPDGARTLAFVQANLGRLTVPAAPC